MSRSSPNGRPSKTTRTSDRPSRWPGRVGRTTTPPPGRPRRPGARRPALDEDDDSGAEDEPKPKAKKKKRKKKKESSASLYVLLAIGAVVLIGGGIGIYFGFVKEDKPTESTAGGGGPKGSPGGPGAAGEWVEHVDAEGKYRIKFPDKPTTENETMNVGGVQQTWKLNQAVAGTAAFFVGAVPIPPDQDQDPERLLDMAQQEIHTQIPNATVTSKQAVTPAGVAGREVVLFAQTPDGAVTGVVRLFVSNARLYMIGVFGLAVQASSPEVVKFFESLKFD